jgi:2-oxoglutarate ferredoxin oxidoreductase subunit gamma
MYHDVIMAGFGGQGILLIGDILALAGMLEGKHVSWMPAYGVEMRGGTANCTVVVSDERIGSPITAKPYGCIAMNGPSLVKYESWVRPGGVAVANATFIKEADFKRDDIKKILVPTLEIATELGDPRGASMVALGAYVQMTGVVSFDSISAALAQTMTGKKAKFVPTNIAAVERGRDFAKEKSKS